VLRRIGGAMGQRRTLEHHLAAGRMLNKCHCG
jgi:hypothetical protein